jgi:nitrate/nitrite-specific signal transduction histidine kinase
MASIDLSLTAEILQYIAWLIALVQLIIGLYLLYLEPRNNVNKSVSASLLIIAINTFAAGLLATAQDSRQAQLPTLLLAATTSVIVVALLQATIVLVYPANNRRHPYQAAVWGLVLIGLLPPALTLIDARFYTQLWYTGVDADTYMGGFVPQASYVNGWLSGPVNLLIYGFLGTILLALLLKALLFDKFVAKQTRRAAFWMLLGIILSIALAATTYTRWNFADVLAEASELYLALYLATNLLYLVAFTTSLTSPSPVTPSAMEPKARRAKLQFRLTILALIVALPLLAGMGIFLTQQAQIVLEQDAAQTLKTTNQAVVEAGEIWLTYNTRALRTLVASPDIISMDPSRQTPSLRALVSTYPDIYLASTTDQNGMNVARSDNSPMIDYSDRSWFQQAISGQPVSYQTMVGGAGQPALVVSMPIRQADNQILGVSMAASDLRLVSRILGQASRTSGATVYLINSEDRILAIAGKPIGILMEDISSYPPVKALRSGVTGNYAFQDINDVGWRSNLNLLTNGWGVIVQQTEESLFAPVRSFQRIALLVLVVGAALLFWLTWLTIRQVMQPIRGLTETAAAITDGDLTLTAPVYGDDELGQLAQSFNTMTAQLRDLIGSLENRVNERTRDLQRRAVQLQVTAQVAREAAVIRNPDRLLQDAARLISEQFNFYHTGIFLLDRPVEAAVSGPESVMFPAASQGSLERPVYAVLRAASSEGGQRMLARGHRLRVGQQGIVGYVAGTGEPRIALDTDKDATFFNNPDLPMTRSEMALPLKIGNRVIGVLDVQSRQANAFKQEDLETLQILADQLAVAIENARLLTESQQALRELEDLYGMQIRQGWQRTTSAMQAGGRPLGYVLGLRGVEPASTSRATGALPAGSSSTTPEIEAAIQLRDQKLGVLRLRRDAELGEWTAQDQALIQDVLDQLALALENARLMEEVRTHARQEELISKIVASTQSSLSLEGVMHTAVQEVVRALNVSRVRIRLGADGDVNGQEPRAATTDDVGDGDASAHGGQS